jgi:hypothetical protein
VLLERAPAQKFSTLGALEPLGRAAVGLQFQLLRHRHEILVKSFTTEDTEDTEQFG